MQSLKLSWPLIAALLLSGCITTGTRAPKTWVSAQCTIPPITLDADDVLTRKTMIAIARVNERLKKICVD